MVFSLLRRKILHSDSARFRRGEKRADAMVTQKGNTEHLVQCFGGFFSIRWTASLGKDQGQRTQARVSTTQTAR
jgi:hypothetical protein